MVVYTLERVTIIDDKTMVNMVMFSWPIETVHGTRGLTNYSAKFREVYNKSENNYW